MCNVDYKNDFGCDVDLSSFSRLILRHGGKSDSRVFVKYNGITSHNAMKIPITFFNDELCHRLVKSVSMMMTFSYQDSDSMCFSL